MILRSEILIDRPCDQVYEAVALRLFDTLHLWHTGVIEVRPLEEGPVRPGSRGVVVSFLKRGKSKFREEGFAVEVVSLIEDRELVLDTSDPHPLIARSRFTLRFEPLRERTLLRVSQDISWGNDWAGFARPFVFLKRKNELWRNLRRLRAALQAPELPPPPRRPVA